MVSVLHLVHRENEAIQFPEVKFMSTLLLTEEGSAGVESTSGSGSASASGSGSGSASGSGDGKYIMA